MKKKYPIKRFLLKADHKRENCITDKKRVQMELERYIKEMAALTEKNKRMTSKDYTLAASAHLKYI